MDILTLNFTLLEGLKVFGGLNTVAALEEREGSKISIPNILTIFMYAPETETAEGVGEYELDLWPR